MPLGAVQAAVLQRILTRMVLRRMQLQQSAPSSDPIAWPNWLQLAFAALTDNQVDKLHVQIVSVIAVCRHFHAVWKAYNALVEATGVSTRFPALPTLTKAMLKTVAEWKHDAVCPGATCLRGWFKHWHISMTFTLPAESTTAPTWSVRTVTVAHSRWQALAVARSHFGDRRVNKLTLCRGSFPPPRSTHTGSSRTPTPCQPSKNRCAPSCRRALWTRSR